MATVLGIWEASRALRTMASIASPKREVGQARANRSAPSLRNVQHLPSPAGWLSLLQRREPVNPPNMSPVKRYDRPTPACTCVLTFITTSGSLHRDPGDHIQLQPSLSFLPSWRSLQKYILVQVHCKIISKSTAAPLQDLAIGRFTAYLR